LGHASTATAATDIPGYVVLPLIDTGYHAAGVRVAIDGRPTVMSIATAGTRSEIDRRFYHGQPYPPGTQSVPGVSLAYKPLVPLQADRNKVALVSDLEADGIDFGPGLMGIVNGYSNANTYNPKHVDVQLGGLMAEDILTAFGAIIDWRRHGIYFNTDPSKRTHPRGALVAAGWTAVPLARTNFGRLAVRSVIDNHPCSLIVNTAAALTIVDRSMLASENRMSQKTVYFRRSGNVFPAHPVILGNWMLGNYRIDSFAVAAAAGPKTPGPETVVGGPLIAGFLGAEVLARHNAIIDVAGNTLYLRPSL
jgi:hypothetical protein